MWASANARRVVESNAAKHRPERISSFSVDFVGYVKPRDRLTTHVRHVGMRNGSLLLEVRTENNEGEPVVKGKAEVKNVVLGYVFTGQGSAEKGMGQDLYESSRLAKRIWDTADAFLLARYGFSILQIVRDNPKSIELTFGGTCGEAMRANYRALHQEIQVRQPDGSMAAETRPLFNDITDSTATYTFSHPEGLLFATQFSQPALVLFELAAFEDMRERGLVPDDCYFAGHSLGEYAALASVASVLSIEALVEIVFLRGITMQNAVQRDKLGRSQYAMVAVNPARVHPTRFREPQLQQVISAITAVRPELLQVVNYNVDNYQYVVAGERGNLRALSYVLDEVRKDPASASSRMQEITAGALQAIAEARDAESGWIELERGTATIPLPGIDVPFHSRFLASGVPAFRQILMQRVAVESIDERKLIGRYIPNVTAMPFNITREYVQRTQKDTQSPELEAVLQDYDKLAANPQVLAHKLVIELLAYQFASPVRWIETQHLFFTSLQVERLIECGPAPTLLTMAKRTLEMGNYSPLVQREILWYNRDKQAIYYQHADEEAPPQPPLSPVAATAPKHGGNGHHAAPKPSGTTPPVTQQAVAPAAAQPTSPPPARPAGGRSVSAPLTALDVLRTMLALKLKKSLPLVPATTSLREAVGGKSALQNELIGDIAKEFGSEPEGAADMDLNSLAARFPNYTRLGALMSAQVGRMVSSKLPGGLGLAALRTLLAQQYGLNEETIDAVLVFMLASQPANRLQTEGEANQWLATVIAEFAAARGVTITAAGAGGEEGKATAVIDSAALAAAEKRQLSLAREHLRALQSYIGEESATAQQLLAAVEEAKGVSDAALKLWLDEHGEVYAEGIRPVFDAKKERRYSSFWNWALQDCLTLYYDYACGRATRWGNDIRERLYHIKNRATPRLVTNIQFYLQKAEQDGRPEITRFINILIDTLRASMDEPPKYRELALPTAPVSEIDESGAIRYKEVTRSDAKDMSAYAQSLSAPAPLAASAAATARAPKEAAARKLLESLKASGVENLTALEAQLQELCTGAAPAAPPQVFLRTPDIQDPSARTFDASLSSAYLSVLQKIASEGVTFQKKVALVTGCGKGSIGLEIVKGLLRGGAKVYITTSRWSAEGLSLYNGVYDDHGGKFSELVVLPFNQASQQDVQALVDYIYEKEKVDLDYIIPFAALSENGRDVGNLDSHSELAHRAMLTNLLRLIGAVKNKKEAKKIVTHPAHVLLPLSPNHGIFGSDGLYAESKLGLEALLNKWHSENWAAYLTLAGAVIGWTRGTALMQSNNVLAAGIEKLGARTFSTKEMCFNLLGLLHPQMVSEAQRQPLWADLNGSLHLVRNLHTVVTEIRTSLQENAALHKAVASDRALDAEVARGSRTDTAVTALSEHITPRANVRVAFPDLPSEVRLRELAHLRGMLDLDKVICVVGFGEVGPFGSARTRWEMEAYGEFSLEGCIELAWSMGLIKYHKDAQWTGWTDAKTKERVRDHLVKSKYEEILLRHTGLRIIEPGMHEGYDPLNKTFLHTVALDKDGPEIECSAADAKHFKQQHGDKVDITSRNGTTFFRLRKGAVMYVPKALRTDRFVVGQVPTTWDPAAFGVPQDIIAQVDRVTLYSLVSVVEAMVAAGVSDPYEFYEYVHVSEIANTIGSGMGGASAIKRMHIDRLMEKPVQADILQETFINTMPAWLNLLLLSASGPIKTPVGACATAVESVEMGVEAIRSGRARIAFVGGYDDYGEHGAYEFAQMQATINNEVDMAAGRTAREQSRPSTSTRAGFVESHGAGTQILMSASLAVRMGVPIYAVVEHVATAMDKIGRSVPAPGRGILTTAREASLRYATPLLDIAYRRQQLDAEIAAAKLWVDKEREAARAAGTPSASQTAKATPDANESAEQEKILTIEYNRRLKKARAHWGNEFYVGNPHIAPLRGALAVYGLTIDDLAVASFHGTSTKGNDYNESQVLQQQLEHLGRTPGNIILTIWQKYLTGHPKGAAAAWMLNGIIQSMLSGVVPGNRNADNIDAQLRKFDHLVFLNRSLHTYGFKAGLLKSFGFGQVGGEVLCIHPDYVLAQLEPEALATYTRLRAARHRAAFRHWQDALVGKTPFVRVKHEPPYVPADEAKVLLNPLARAQYHKETKSWRFVPSKGAHAAASAAAAAAALAITPAASGSTPSTPRSKEAQQHHQQQQQLPTEKATGMRRTLSHTALTHLEVTLRELQHGMRETLDRGLGVDAQLISEIEVSISNSDFVSRNFTPAEAAYCRAAADPSSSFAGRWAAKEAVIKAISSSDTGEHSRNLWAGGAAPLRDIEVLPSASGAPKVILHGHAREVATLLGISSIKVSISHSGEYAIAQAIAR